MVKKHLNVIKKATTALGFMLSGCGPVDLEQIGAESFPLAVYSDQTSSKDEELKPESELKVVQPLILDQQTDNVFWPFTCMGEVYQTNAIDDCEKYYPFLGSLFHYYHPGTGRRLVQAPYFDPNALYAAPVQFYDSFYPFFAGGVGQWGTFERWSNQQDAFRSRKEKIRQNLRKKQEFLERKALNQPFSMGAPGFEPND